MDQTTLQTMNLTDFIRWLRHGDRPKHKNVNEAMSWLQRTLQKPFVVRCERGPLEDVWSSNDDENNQSPTRVIISVMRYVCDKKEFRHHQLLRSCNGLILEWPSWNVLAVPPPMLFRVQVNELQRRTVDLSAYDISLVNDGSSVSLYWYGDQWQIASKNGWDVSEYKWLGQTTYGSAITEIIGGDVISSLSHDYCYTFGFRHPDFHPWNEGSCNEVKVPVSNYERPANEVKVPVSNCERPANEVKVPVSNSHAWFIQRVSLTDANGSSTDPKINIETSSTPNDEVLPCGISRWYALTDTTKRTPMNIDNVNRRISTVMIDEIKNFAPMATAPRPGKPHYGFILRSRDPSLPDHIIESELYSWMRNLIYNLRDKRIDGDRIQFIVLRAYLGNVTRSQFIALFPQYRSMYDAYKALFSSLTQTIAAYIRDSKNLSKAQLVTGTEQIPAGRERFDFMAKRMAVHIMSSCPSAFPSSSHLTKLVYDFLHNKRYVMIYHVGFSGLVTVE